MSLSITKHIFVIFGQTSEAYFVYNNKHVHVFSLHLGLCILTKLKAFFSSSSWLSTTRTSISTSSRSYPRWSPSSPSSFSTSPPATTSPPSTSTSSSRWSGWRCSAATYKSSCSTSWPSPGSSRAPSPSTGRREPAVSRSANFGLKENSNPF